MNEETERMKKVTEKIFEESLKDQIQTAMELRRRGGARPGSGRPRSEIEKTALTIRLKVSELEEIRRRAEKAKMTVSEYIRSSCLKD